VSGSGPWLQRMCCAVQTVVSLYFRMEGNWEENRRHKARGNRGTEANSMAKCLVDYQTKEYTGL
jgi:hypothetical protein